MAPNGTKASKKKAAATANRTVSPSPLPSPAPEKMDGQDDGHDHPLIREIQKSIRNVNKKLVNASKTDAVIAEHKDKSLDELVANRIINADQRAQILKKPALKEQLVQLDEKQSLLLKMAADVESTVTAKLTEKLTENFEKEKAEAAQRADAEQKEKFMVLSQFLRLVADRRSEGADPTIDQNAALESLLATFFGGDQEAVSAMQKLVDGVDEAVVSTSGDVLEATFGTLKAAAEHHLEVLAYNTTAEIEGDAAAAATSDPTIANIAATEIAAGDKELSSSDPTPVVAAETNGVHPPAEPASDEEDYKNSSTAPQDEPARPPDAPETETAVEEPSFAPPKHAPSWADDHPEPATQASPATDPDDGFTAVHRNKPRGEGNWRGRGRGEWRGKSRGDGRGRGRGGGRGGVAHRGPRRDDA